MCAYGIQRAAGRRLVAGARCGRDDSAGDGSVSAPAGVAVFAVEFLPGQFDQRADSASECVQLISQGERPDVRSAKVYVLEGELSAADVDSIKHYVINPIEARGHLLRRAGLCICRS